MMANVVGSIGAAEREREQTKRVSRGSSGSGVGSTGGSSAFAMPKSFEKAKRAGLDGTAPCSPLPCFRYSRLVWVWRLMSRVFGWV